MGHPFGGWYRDSVVLFLRALGLTVSAVILQYAHFYAACIRT